MAKDKKVKVKNNKGIKGKIRDIVEAVLIVAFCGAFVYIALNLFLDWKSQSNLNSMRDAVKASRLQTQEIAIPEEAKAQNAEKKQQKEAEQKALEKEQEEAAKEAQEAAEEEAKKNKNKNKKPVLDIYKELYEKNENFFGWLYVDETELEYPVMKGPDNKFYLSHDMDRKYDKHGMLIMDDGCDPDAKVPQLLIYGHNVNSGKMFGDLLFYKEEAYCNYHPEINFDTLYEKGRYKIFAAFTTTVDEAQDQLGLFTSYDFEDEKTYDEFVKWAKDRSLYERDFTPKYGAPILTLVTCEHSRDEGRFVVMAAQY